MLADVPGVAVREVVVDGRDAVELEYVRMFNSLIDSTTVTIDPATARVISERTSNPGLTYESTTTLTEVVDEIPAEVMRTLREHRNGHRVCLDPDGCVQ